MILNIEYKVPEFIDSETFKSLSYKEQDFIVLLHSKKFTKQEIMRLLYIESRTAYYRLQKAVREKIHPEYREKKYFRPEYMVYASNSRRKKSQNETSE